MIYLQENLKFLRKQKSWTQGDLAEKLGLKRSLIGAYEEGRAVPKLSIIQQMALLFDLSIDQILTMDWTKQKVYPPKSNLKVLSTVVDFNNEERICIVPIKASAGYLNGLANPEFVAELPHFALPVNELMYGNTYRVFQIKGDSMLPIASGSYIFCNYIESLDGIRDGKAYVVITADEGIVYKRIFNCVEEDGTLLLKSDNDAYNPYRVPIDHVLEVWQAIGFLSFEIPEPDEMDLNNLSLLVFKMQEEIKKLKEKK